MVRGSTDENGVAVFEVEEGSYQIIASKSGYVMQSVRIAISQNMTLELTLEPRPRGALISPIAFIEIGIALISLAKEARKRT